MDADASVNSLAAAVADGDLINEALGGRGLLHGSRLTRVASGRVGAAGVDMGGSGGNHFG